jgi:hypothetical protein
MAQKKNKSKSATSSGKARSKNQTKSKATAPKPKAGVKAASKPVARSGGQSPKIKSAKASAKPNGKQAAAEAPVKKKPPSITITRPEVTRPPVVLPPPRPVEAPIGAPSILVPKGGLPITSLTPILRWMYVGGATQYEVEWSPDAQFGRGHSVSQVAQQTAISLDETNELKPATNYRWRVRGGNEAGWGPWSPPESFRSPDKS